MCVQGTLSTSALLLKNRCKLQRIWEYFAGASCTAWGVLAQSVEHHICPTRTERVAWNTLNIFDWYCLWLSIAVVRVDKLFSKAACQPLYLLWEEPSFVGRGYNFGRGHTTSSVVEYMLCTRMAPNSIAGNISI